MTLLTKEKLREILKKIDETGLLRAYTLYNQSIEWIATTGD